VIRIQDIKGIILDWGGVVCQDPAPGFVRYISAKLSCPAEHLAPVLLRHLVFFQRGGSEEDFWKYVCDDLHIPLPPGPLWREALTAIYAHNHPLITWAEKKHEQGYLIALLTNTEKPARDFHLSLGYDFFDARIFSCDIQIAKPDRIIYEKTAQILGLKPEECLMIDDKPENIWGAQQAGMQGLLYKNHQDLIILFP